MRHSGRVTASPRPLPRRTLIALAAAWAVAPRRARAGSATPSASGVAALVDAARATDSAELVVLHEGRVLVDERFDRGGTPIETMSITKSVLSLAAGLLIDEGKLEAEAKVGRYFPEIARRAPDMTVLHLLGHTAGYDAEATTRPIYAARSFVAEALATPLLRPPGQRFAYSNRGANLLAGLLGKAAKMPVDRYVTAKLFAPLGIRRVWWAEDRARQPQGMAGLHLHAADLAKLGQLVLDGGEWQGRALVSRAWMRRSTVELAPVQPPDKRLGLMWWLVPDSTRAVIDAALLESWRGGGVPEDLVTRAQPLVGRTFTARWELRRAYREQFGEHDLGRLGAALGDRDLTDARYSLGPVVGTYAAGTLGQWLVVLPGARVVAARLRRSPRSAAEKKNDAKTLPDFIERVRALAAP